MVSSASFLQQLSTFNENIILLEALSETKGEEINSLNNCNNMLESLRKDKLKYNFNIFYPLLVKELEWYHQNCCLEEIIMKMMVKNHALSVQFQELIDFKKDEECQEIWNNFLDEFNAQYDTNLLEEFPSSHHYYYFTSLIEMKKYNRYLVSDFDFTKQIEPSIPNPIKMFPHFYYKFYYQQEPGDSLEVASFKELYWGYLQSTDYLFFLLEEEYEELVYNSF